MEINLTKLINILLLVKGIIRWDGIIHFITSTGYICLIITASTSATTSTCINFNAGSGRRRWRTTITITRTATHGTFETFREIFVSTSLGNYKRTRMLWTYFTDERVTDQIITVWYIHTVIIWSITLSSLAIMEYFIA